jgi:transcriptional regulator
MSGSPFVPTRTADVSDFVGEQVLALVISHGPPAHVTPLPLLPEIDAVGTVAGFLGHFGRSNPQIQALDADPRALIVFMGPHAHIPTAWVSKPKWAPTWNYALAWFEVELRFMPEENDHALAALVNRLETDGWTPDRMEERYAQLAPRILAFRAQVLNEGAKFKLGQDESHASFAEILDHLGPSPLADLMRRARPGAAT